MFSTWRIPFLLSIIVLLLVFFPAWAWGQDPTSYLRDQGIAVTPKAFIAFAGQGDTDKVSTFLATGMSPDARGKGGVTPLYAAARNGHLQVVKMLLDKGAAADGRNNYRNTPLIGAAFKGHRKVVALLLRNRADVNAKNKVGDSPLHWAAANGHAKTVKILLAGGAMVSLKNNKGQTPRALAKGKNFALVVKMLTPANAMQAAAMGDTERVALDLQRGAKINFRDDSGMSLLMAAAERGQLEVVKQLVEKGATVQIKAARPKGMPVWMQFLELTALDFAAENHHRNTVEFLLEKGGNVSDYSMVILAMRGDAEMISYLASHGGNINATHENEGGAYSPLIAAVKNKNQGMVALVIKLGAEIDARHEDMSALDWAVSNKKNAMARILLKAGANPNLPSKDGTTPLMEAAGKGDFHMVRVLTQYRVNAGMKNNKGETAASIAKRKGHTRIVNLLARYIY